MPGGLHACCAAALRRRQSACRPWPARQAAALQPSLPAPRPSRAPAAPLPTTPRYRSKYNIPTAQYETFTDPAAAKAFITQVAARPPARPPACCCCCRRRLGGWGRGPAAGSRGGGESCRLLLVAVRAVTVRQLAVWPALIAGHQGAALSFDRRLPPRPLPALPAVRRPHCGEDQRPGGGCVCWSLGLGWEAPHPPPPAATRWWTAGPTCSHPASHPACSLWPPTGSLALPAAAAPLPPPRLAGKGVIVAQTLEEAFQAVDDMMVNNAFGEAGGCWMLAACLLLGGGSRAGGGGVDDMMVNNALGEAGACPAALSAYEQCRQCTECVL